jgi:hypothetical protein
VLGTQHASIKHISEFKEQIAPCRTFSFFHELEYLINNNLIKGGDINNAIVVVDKPVTDEQVARISKVFHKQGVKITEGGILNNLELRFPNEPARHKLLDVIGDLALVGFPFKAHVIANRPGHSSNIAFARKIKEHIKKYRHRQQIPCTILQSRRLWTFTPLKKSCRTGTRFCWSIKSSSLPTSMWSPSRMLPTTNRSSRAIFRAIAFFRAYCNAKPWRRPAGCLPSPTIRKMITIPTFLKLITASLKTKWCRAIP